MIVIRREVGLTEARQEAVDALRVLVEHFCYSEQGLHGVADEAFNGT